MESAVEEEPQPWLTVSTVVWVTIVFLVLTHTLAASRPFRLLMDLFRFARLAIFYLLPQYALNTLADQSEEGSTEQEVLKAMTFSYLAAIPAYSLYRFIAKSYRPEPAPLEVQCVFVTACFVFMFFVHIYKESGGFREDHWEYLKTIPGQLYHGCTVTGRCPPQILLEEAKRTFVQWKMGDSVKAGYEAEPASSMAAKKPEPFA